jgi:transcription initiation factor TFIIIB Brf1 subunit/transcription initiation factor TFIIB
MVPEVDISGSLVCILCGAVIEDIVSELRVDSSGRQRVYENIDKHKLYEIETRRLTSSLNLNSYYDSVISLVKQVINENPKYKPKSRKILVAACVYLVIRRENKALSCRDVAIRTPCSVTDVFKTFKRLLELGIAKGITTVDSYVYLYKFIDVLDSFVKQFDIPVNLSYIDIYNRSNFIIKTLKKAWYTSGKNPFNMAGTIVALSFSSHYGDSYNSLMITFFAEKCGLQVKRFKVIWSSIVSALIEQLRKLPGMNDLNSKVLFGEFDHLMELGGISDKVEFKLADSFPIAFIKNQEKAISRSKIVENLFDHFRKNIDRASIEKLLDSGYLPVELKGLEQHDIEKLLVVNENIDEEEIAEYIKTEQEVQLFKRHCK